VPIRARRRFGAPPARTVAGMARALRIEVPGGIHHVTSRGVRRLPICFSDDDYALFVSLLGLVAERLGWRVYGYCLMPNHFHLVVETPRGNLTQGMHMLKGRYARAFNDAYGLTGHVFEARFAAVLVARDAHLTELVRYVHLNPVRAGLCMRPGDWRWSSYRVLAGHVPAPRWLVADETLELFGRSSTVARRRLARFLADGLRAPTPQRLARPP
jgi:REP element-mobilizing transposase RayT